MRHPDPEDLALVALGEDLAPDVAAHLDSCDTCAAEVASLRRVVGVGRSLTADDVPTAPPAAVWERVQAELGLGGSSSSGGRPTGTRVPVLEHPAPQAPPAVTRVSDGSAVVELSARRRRPSFGWVAAAAAAGLAFGTLGGAWWATSRTDTGPAEATVLARATLDPLPGWDAAGSAMVEEESDGARVVVVDVAAELGDEGYREVWLIAEDLSGMVSLGLLDGAQGRFVVPAGLDLTRYPVVDVSEEPFDGDATHSGDSIVRGTLEV